MSLLLHYAMRPKRMAERIFFQIFGVKTKQEIERYLEETTETIEAIADHAVIEPENNHALVEILDWEQAARQAFELAIDACGMVSPEDDTV